MKSLILKLLVLSFMFPSGVLAHTGAGETASFMQGICHPIGGVDHLLAMVAVGLWAAQMGGRAKWVVPCTFVGVMILGGVLGFTGVTIPYVEAGIIISVLVLGILIASAYRFPMLYSTIIVGLFAMVHGHAHGAEMPVALGAVSYTVGFSLGTAMLHTAGMMLGALMQKTNLNVVTRIAGSAVAFCGIFLAVS